MLHQFLIILAKICKNYTFNKLHNTRNALYKWYAFYQSLFALSFFKVQTTYKKESPYFYKRPLKVSIGLFYLIIKTSVLQKISCSIKGKKVSISFFYLVFFKQSSYKKESFYKRQKGKYQKVFLIILQKAKR